MLKFPLFLGPLCKYFQLVVEFSKFQGLKWDLDLQPPAGRPQVLV